MEKTVLSAVAVAALGLLGLGLPCRFRVPALLAPWRLFSRPFPRWRRKNGRRWVQV